MYTYIHVQISCDHGHGSPKQPCSKGTDRGALGSGRRGQPSQRRGAAGSAEPELEGFSGGRTNSALRCRTSLKLWFHLFACGCTARTWQGVIASALQAAMAHNDMYAMMHGKPTRLRPKWVMIELLA